MSAANRTVFNQGRFRFFFYSADLAERMHVHVENGDGEVKVWMDSFSVVIMRRGMSADDTRSAVRIARDRRTEIERAWREEESKASGAQPAESQHNAQGRRQGCENAR